MADVLNFPTPLARIGRGGIEGELRAAHDGYRAVSDVVLLAAKHHDRTPLPLSFLDDLYRQLTREAQDAERQIAAAVTKNPETSE